MTQQIYLAANLVAETLVFGHLQIVYQDSAGDLFENETTSPGFPYFFGDWAYPEFGREHDNATNTPGYGNPNDYAIVSLSLRPEQTAKHVWELMAQIHASLSTGGHGLDYDIGQNSNSYAASVLSVIGIDIADYLSDVTPPDVQGFPGVGTNVFEGAKTGGLFSGYDTPIPLTIAGTSGNDYVKAGIGNDDLGGAGGNDTLMGGNGNDQLRGGAQHDWLDGGNGNDNLHGESGNDTLLGGGGNDTLLGGTNEDRLDGGNGNDNLLGESGHDTLIGGNGNDTLDGGWFNDWLYSGNGNDLLQGDGGVDRLFGGSGNDTLLGGDGNDIIYAGANNDRVDGGAGNDRLSGGAFADVFVFVGAFGDDTITDFDEFNNIEDIDLSGVASITDYADLLANHMTQVGAHVLIDDGLGNTITVLNVSIGDMNDVDFTF